MAMYIAKKPQLSSEDKLSIILAHQLGVKNRKNGRMHERHRNTVRKLAKRYEEEPDAFLERKKYDSSQRYKLTDEEKSAILEYASINNDSTLQEIIDRLALAISRTTLSRFLKANNVKLFPKLKKQQLERPEIETDGLETETETETNEESNVQRDQLWPAK